MLLKIRDSLTGPMAAFILALLLVPFAFWGVTDYFGAAGAGNVARVGDIEITKQQLDNAYRNDQAQLQQRLGDAYDPDLFPVEERRRQLLDRLIRTALLEQRIAEQQFRVSDAALLRELQAIPQFQTEGRFDPETYKLAVTLQGMQPAVFESRLRDNLASNQLVSGVAQSAFVTDHELDRYLALDGQERVAAWLEVGARSFRDQVELTDEEIIAYYEENKDRFLSEETVDVAYIEVEATDLEREVVVTEELLREFYENEAQLDYTPERRRARHILFSTRERSEEEAIAAAQAVRAEIEAGASFETLARERSADSASAADGGDLGWLDRDSFVGPFSDSLFSLEPGQVSEPVVSDFGVHLIKLEEVDESNRPAFASVRYQLEQDYRTNRALDRYYDMANEMRDLAWESADDLQAVADVAGLEVETVQGLARGSREGVFSNPEVARVVFSDRAVETGEIQPPIELGDGHAMFLRVIAHSEPREQPLEAVRERVEQTMITERSVEMARAQAESLLARHRDEGVPLADLAAEQGVTYNPERAITRNDPTVDRGLSRALFETPSPVGDEASVELSQIANGRYAVIRLSEVRSGLREVSDEASHSTRMNLTTRLGAGEFSAYIEQMVDDGEVRIEDRYLAPGS